VMIVEGYFDVVRLVSAGFEWVVAPLGTALTEDQAAMLPRYARQAFLLYDNDKAGLKASFRSGDQLLRQRMSVQIVTLPEGEDPDSYVDKFGAEKLVEQINGSVDVFERKLRELQRTGYFSDLRKRRVAVDKLLPTIRAATDLVTRELYLTMAAEVSGVPRDALAREVDGAPQLGLVQSTSSSNAPYSSKEIKEPPSSTASSSFEDRYAESEDFDRERPLIRILLHVRSRIEYVVETIGPEDLRDPALKDIYRALLAVPGEAPLEEVANRLNRRSVYCFEELQGDPIGVGEEIDSQIDGSIAKILDAALCREIAETLRQLSIATDAEKDSLLKRLVELKKQRRELHANRSVRPAIRQS
jgi:DNA primase